MSWLSHFFDHNASVITMLWLMVFMIKSANIAVGIFHLKSIKRNSSTIISEQWIEHFDRLALRLGISGKVLLAQSGQITSPIVLGIFKPIVLIPLGFLTELPVDQVEAILLHELAHIKRRDYLVNLLQSVAENIFFFNPAIFWLSKLIREERECCCDDLAISALDNKSSFVRALVSYQEYRIASQDEIVAFTGKTNHLFYRIKRIIISL